MCTRAPSIFEFQNLNQNVSEANCVSLKFSHMRHLLESAYCTGQWEYETSNWLQKTYTGQCFIALNSGFSHNISIANTTLALMYFHLSTFICCIFYRLFFATTIFRFLIAKNCQTFWQPNLTKDMESFSKFYGIAFSQEEREVPWIIIRGVVGTLSGYLLMWPPISLRPNSLCSRGVDQNGLPSHCFYQNRFSIFSST